MYTNYRFGILFFNLTIKHLQVLTMNIKLYSYNVKDHLKQKKTVVLLYNTKYMHTYQ